MTSSAGASGLTRDASPPSSTMASRMVARSTMQGTPVKSCMITRPGVNWISVSGSAVGCQAASARMWSAVMLAPSSVRSRFSSRIFRLYGRASDALDRGEPEDLVAGPTGLEGAPWPRRCPCSARCSLRMRRSRRAPSSPEQIYLDVEISTTSGCSCHQAPDSARWRRQVRRGGSGWNGRAGAGLLHRLAQGLVAAAAGPAGSRPGRAPPRRPPRAAPSWARWRIRARTSDRS